MTTGSDNVSIQDRMDGLAAASAIHFATKAESNRNASEEEKGIICLVAAMMTLNATVIPLEPKARQGMARRIGYGLSQLGWDEERISALLLRAADDFPLTTNQKLAEELRREIEK